MKGNWLVCACVLAVVSPSMAADAVFKARLSSGEYEQRISRLPADRLDPAKVAASALPDFGVMLNDVAPGSQADRAGLSPGWVIVRCNGTDYWDHRMGRTSAMDGVEGYEMEAVSPQGEKKTFKFEPGRIGYNCSTHARPEQYLLRAVPRGEWDRDLLVVPLAWHLGDHELAETALARAVEKGMPAHPVRDFHEAILSLDRGDQARAKELAAGVLAAVRKDDGIPRYYRGGLRTLALSTGDYDFLKELSKDVEEFPNEIQPEMIAPWKAWAATAPAASLISRARPLAGEDAMPGVVTVADGWEKYYRLGDAAALRDGSHFVAVRPPGYDDFCFAPAEPAKDLLWTIEGAYGDLEAPQTFHEIAFYLVDLRARKRAAEETEFHPPLWNIAGIRVRHDVKDGRVLFLTAGRNAEELPTQRSFPRIDEVTTKLLAGKIGAGDAKPEASRKRGFRLELVRLGGEAEVIVNGVPYLRLPVDESVGELGCVIHSTGMAVAIDAMSLKKLNDR